MHISGTSQASESRTSANNGIQPQQSWRRSQLQSLIPAGNAASLLFSRAAQGSWEQAASSKASPQKLLNKVTSLGSHPALQKPKAANEHEDEKAGDREILSVPEWCHSEERRL